MRNKEEIEVENISSWSWISWIIWTVATLVCLIIAVFSGNNGVKIFFGIITIPMAIVSAKAILIENTPNNHIAIIEILGDRFFGKKLRFCEEGFRPILFHGLWKNRKFINIAKQNLDMPPIFTLAPNNIESDFIISVDWRPDVKNLFDHINVGGEDPKEWEAEAKNRLKDRISSVTRTFPRIATGDNEESNARETLAKLLNATVGPDKKNSEVKLKQMLSEEVDGVGVEIISTIINNIIPKGPTYEQILRQDAIEIEKVIQVLEAQNLHEKAKKICELFGVTLTEANELLKDWATIDKGGASLLNLSANTVRTILTLVNSLK